MKTPNFEDSPFVEKIDDKFYLTSIWKQVLMQLLSQLQINLSDEGFRIPSQTTENLGVIAANTNNTTIPILVWDSTTSQLKINVNGTFRVVPYT